MAPHARMTPLTQVAGAFRARVLEARLQSEGIGAELRGSVDSPYGFTVGDMARIDVYVPEDELEDARYVLLADEVDAALLAPTEWWDPGSTRRRIRHWLWWVAAVLLAVAVIGPLLAAAAAHW